MVKPQTKRTQAHQGLPDGREPVGEGRVSLHLEPRAASGSDGRQLHAVLAHCGRDTFLRLHGGGGIRAAQPLRRLLRELVRGGAASITLDLGALRHADAVAVAGVAIGFNRRNGGGCSIALVLPSQSAQDIVVRSCPEEEVSVCVSRRHPGATPCGTGGQRLPGLRFAGTPTRRRAKERSER